MCLMGILLLEKEHFSRVSRACYFRSLISLQATIYFISNKIMYGLQYDMCVLCVFMPMFNYTLAM
jgi:hypothetical protein